MPHHRCPGMAPCQGLCGWETTKEQTRVEKETFINRVWFADTSIPQTQEQTYQATAHKAQDSEGCRNQRRAVPGRPVLTIYSKSLVLAVLTGTVQFFSSTSQTQHSRCEISSEHGPSTTAQQHMWQPKCATKAKTLVWQVTTTSSSAHEDTGSLLTSP